MWNHKFSPEVSHLWQWVPLFTTIFWPFWWGGLRMSHDVTYSPGESQYFAKSSFCTRLHEHQAQLLKGTSMEALPSPLKSPQILKSYCFLYIPWYPWYPVIFRYIYIHIVDAETPIHNWSTAGLQEPSQLRKMEAQEAQDGSTSEI